MKIGIFVNRDKDPELTVTRMVLSSMNRYGMEILLSNTLCEELGIGTGLNDGKIMENADLIVSLGGDGTLLSTARSVFESGIPVFGINLGNLGFLAEVEVKDIDKAMECLAKGEYTTKTRMVLEARVIRDGNTVFSDIAINDVVVTRIGLSRILHLKVYLDNQYVDSYPGDGVIVSTPTGSTAYTLSAGGPIVQPDMQLMITTPICPHILYSRSFITDPDRELIIQVDEDYPDCAMLTVDGQTGFDIRAGDKVIAKRKKKGISFVSVSDINFFDVLRSKIHGRNLNTVK